MGTLSEEPEKNLYKALSQSNVISVASLCFSTEPLCSINAHGEFSRKMPID